MKLRRSKVAAVTVGVLGGVAAVYGSSWLSSILYYAGLRTWSESRSLLVLVPVFAFVGIGIGVATVAVSRTALAAQTATALVLIAAIITFAIGGGRHYGGWIPALAMYAVLGGGIYFVGMVIARRWLSLSKPGVS